MLVVHTFYENHHEEVIRIISARAAESRERKAYEEAHKGAEARPPSHRPQKETGTLISPMLPRFSTGAAPKSACSIAL
jgi:hypothetical protein